MQITKGRISKSHFVLIHARDGVGKTTLASQAESPIFMEPEQGSANLDVARLPFAKDWADAMKQLDWLSTQDEFKTLVVDTVDWMEELCFKHVISTCPKGAKSMETCHGGYAKGYKMALETWRDDFKPRIETLRKKGMNIILLCHSQVSEFMDPSAETNYNRYELKLYEGKNCSVRAFFREWVDSVLFCKVESYSSGEGKSARGISTDIRIMFTSWDAAFDAKTRFNIPKQIDMSWISYTKSVEADKPQTVDSVVARLDPLIPQIKEETTRKAVIGHIDNAKKDGNINTLLAYEKRILQLIA